MLVHSDYLHDNRVKREAETLVKHGLKVTCACIGTHIPERLNDVDLVSYVPKNKKGKLLFLEVIRFFGKAINKGGYDYIHAHDLDALLAAILYLRKKETKVIYDSHEYYTESAGLGSRRLTRFVWKLIERYCIVRAHHVITVNDSIASLLQASYKLNRTPTVVRNFTDLKPAGDITEANISQAFRLQEQCEILLLYHGTIREGRGLDLLFDLIRKNKRYGAIICGNGHLHDHYQQLAEKYDINGRLLFTGYINSAEFLKLAGIADIGYCYIEPIVTSYYFSLPNKLSEYAQAGLPIVASDLPEITKIVNEYKLGAIIPPGLQSSRELESAVMDILESLDQYKLNAQSSRTVLSWKSECNQLLNVYGITQ